MQVHHGRGSALLGESGRHDRAWQKHERQSASEDCSSRAAMPERSRSSTCGSPEISADADNLCDVISLADEYLF